MRRALLAFAVATLVAAPAVAAAPPKQRTAQAKPAGPGFLRVKSEDGFARAAQALRHRGGTIVLRPALYRRLVVGPRGSAPLHVVGTRGARVANVLFDGTRNVTFGKVRVGPIGGHALFEVRRSRNVTLHDLHVSAKATRFSASVLIPDSVGVTIRDSTFTRCGDRAPDFVNCVTLYRWSHRVSIVRNRFHDCFGCDFVHGRFGTRLTIRDNTFDRALPCSMGKHRCGHNDLVQLFKGRHLLVEGNRFGVYRGGGAQLYLTNDVDYATIVNNVFRGTDPKVPGYRARMGIVIGANESKRLPHYAKVINNTILTGHRRIDGYAGSIRMSSRYGSVKRWKRPIVANNVIGLLEQPARVCNASQRAGGAGGRPLLRRRRGARGPADDPRHPRPRHRRRAQSRARRAREAPPRRRPGERLRRRRHCRHARGLSRGDAPHRPRERREAARPDRGCTRPHRLRRRRLHDRVRVRAPAPAPALRPRARGRVRPRPGGPAARGARARPRRRRPARAPWRLRRRRPRGRAARRGGGDRAAVDAALAARADLAWLRDRALPRFFTVPEPRRRVLEALPYDLYAVEVAELAT